MTDNGALRSRMLTMAKSSFKARVDNRITDREMIHNLPLLGRQVEVAVHLLIVERADTGGSQPERFRSEIKALADGACFEMRISITAVAVGARGTV